VFVASSIQLQRIRGVGQVVGLRIFYPWLRDQPYNSPQFLTFTFYLHFVFFY